MASIEKYHIPIAANQEKCAEIFRHSLTGSYCILCYHCGRQYVLDSFIEIYEHIEKEHYENRNEQKKTNDPKTSKSIDVLNPELIFLPEPLLEIKTEEEEISIENALTESSINTDPVDVLLDKCPEHELVEEITNQTVDMYKCDICLRIFNGKSPKKTFQNHMRSKHPDLYVVCKTRRILPKKLTNEYFSVYECDMCNFTCSIKNDIKLHMNKYHRSRHFMCDFCDFSTYDRTYLREHIKRRHRHVQRSADNIDKITKTKNTKLDHEKCNFCGYTGTNKMVRYHMTKEHPVEYAAERSKIFLDKKTNCHICGKAYRRIANYTQHMEKHNNLKTHKCPICNKGFNLESYLVKHLKRHSDTCNVCQKKFPNRVSLLAHVKTHSTEKPHKCDVCKAQFGCSSSLKIHFRRHTGDKSYQCYICGLNYYSTALLNTHIKKKHTEREKIHQCDICNKKFYTERLLQSHQFLHTGIRPYICQDCGKDFASRRVLRNHSFIHLGKRLKCRHCDMTFSQPSGRRCHERSRHDIL